MHEEEEHRLVDYLKTTQESNSSELLLLHYLQRSRFIEAVRLNNRLKSMGLVRLFSDLPYWSVYQSYLLLWLLNELNVYCFIHWKGETDAASRERATARNAIVDCYHHVLPKVQRKLAFGPEQLPRKPAQTRKEGKEMQNVAHRIEVIWGYEPWYTYIVVYCISVIRPVPLSSVVNRVQRSQAITQAMLINSVMEKVREVTEESTDTPREEAQG